MRQAAGLHELDPEQSLVCLFPAGSEFAAFQQRLREEFEALGLEASPDAFLLEERSTFGDAVERVCQALPGDDSWEFPIPPQPSDSDVKAAIQKADRLDSSVWRRQGFMFFLGAVALGAILTAVWPKPPRPAPPPPAPKPGPNELMVTVGLKPGQLQPPSPLPACVSLVLAPTNRATDSPQPVLPFARLLAVRPLTDRLWLDLALPHGDAERLAQQLGKYEVQVLKHAKTADCPSPVTPPPKRQ